uniref:hypothetical protein n=1 Tax=Aerococcus urinaeequi TaxID=51665 RepID=UPI00352AA5E5
MAQQKQIFDGRIRIWSDNGEFMAEYKKYNEYIDDELVCRYLVCRYYAKSNSVTSVVESLFRELIDDGIITVGTKQ